MILGFFKAIWNCIRFLGMCLTLGYYQPFKKSYLQKMTEVNFMSMLIRVRDHTNSKRYLKSDLKKIMKLINKFEHSLHYPSENVTAGMVSMFPAHDIEFSRIKTKDDMISLNYAKDHKVLLEKMQMKGGFYGNPFTGICFFVKLKKKEDLIDAMIALNSGELRCTQLYLKNFSTPLLNFISSVIAKKYSQHCKEFGIEPMQWEGSCWHSRHVPDLSSPKNIECMHCRTKCSDKKSTQDFNEYLKEAS